MAVIGSEVVGYPEHHDLARLVRPVVADQLQMPVLHDRHQVGAGDLPSRERPRRVSRRPDRVRSVTALGALQLVKERFRHRAPGDVLGADEEDVHRLATRSWNSS